MSNKTSRKPIMRVQIRLEQDVVIARQRARQIAILFNLDGQDQIRFATAISELTRNVFQYAKQGMVEFSFDEQSEFQTLFARVSDSGPGINNLDEILNGSYVSRTGMGIGLTGARKLMDDFEISSSPENGTSILLGKRLNKKFGRVNILALAKITEQLASQRALNSIEEVQLQNRELLSALEQLQARQNELRLLNEELQETNRGVVALYSELDEKALSLQRANEIKTKFLSNMTHEFRTPLSSVLGLTRILLDRMDGELNSEQEKQVRLIQQSSTSLLELVNDLLDLSKVEAGKIAVKTTQFEVAEIFGSLRGVFRPVLGNDSKVDLNIETPQESISFESDEGKISQILRNLVSNALKFTEAGSVTVSAQSAAEDTVIFKVTDTGIGIAPEHLNLVFQDYTQLSSALQSKIKGTGLGLPLSRQLARLLGGDVWAESLGVGGSTFYARIPRKFTGNHDAEFITADHEDTQNLPENLPDTSSSSAQFCVLIVDDDEPSRYVLKSLLRNEIAANFIEAANGRIGLEKLSKHKPDVVFLDLSMPEIDGSALLKIIKSGSTHSDVPIIINTAKKMTGSERSLLLVDAVAVLSKDRQDKEAALKELREALQNAGFDYKRNPLKGDLYVQ